jgi:hypothetical protein
MFTARYEISLYYIIQRHVSLLMVDDKDMKLQKKFVKNVLFGVTYDLRSCDGSGG